MDRVRLIRALCLTSSKYKVYYKVGNWAIDMTVCDYAFAHFALSGEGLTLIAFHRSTVSTQLKPIGAVVVRFDFSDRVPEHTGEYYAPNEIDDFHSKYPEYEDIPADLIRDFGLPPRGLCKAV